MKVLQVLLFCSVSVASCEMIHQKKEGTRFRVNFFFSSPKSLKFFCKRQCAREDVLVRTEQDAERNGRYSTEYQARASGGGLLSVTISNLTTLDSGRYRFGVGASLVPESFRDFELRVLNATEQEVNVHSGAEGANVSVLCPFFSARSTKLFCKDECEGGRILVETTDDRARRDRYSIAYEPAGAKFLLRVSVSDLRASDSGLYACGLGESASSASFQRFEIRVNGDASRPASVHPAPETRSNSTGFPASSRLIQLLPFLPLVISTLVAAALLVHRLRPRTCCEAGPADVTLLAVTYEHDAHDNSFHSCPDDFQEPETL